MEKIDVAKLLKDCPQGMELDCTEYDGIVKFDGFNKNNPYTIRISVMYDGVIMTHNLTKYGQTSVCAYNKCVIFPKGKTTWEGFHRPFKPGDIVITNSNEHAFIYSGENDKFWECYCGVYCGTRNICINSKQWSDKQHELRLATKKEIEKLFQVIKDNGYKWNPETKTLEKLIELKFKVGDRIKSINSDRCYIIKDIEFDRYILNDDCFLRFNDEHIFELVVEPKFKIGDKVLWNYDTRKTNTISKVTLTENRGYVYWIDTEGCSSGWWGENELTPIPDKFDISTLIPFESRVLARYCKDSKWIPTFWGSYDKEDPEYPYNCCGMLFAQCIPYEGNEYLLNTADDCDEYFKTWK